MAAPSAEFTTCVVIAVQSDRRRRTVIRWGSIVTVAAACFVGALMVQSPATNDTLFSETRDLVVKEEAAQLNDILGMADDLSLLTPVVKKPAIVDVLTTPGS
jgi:hypothetical protein